jgi:hypothetical protein
VRGPGRRQRAWLEAAAVETDKAVAEAIEAAPVNAKVYRTASTGR